MDFSKNVLRVYSLNTCSMPANGSGFRDGTHADEQAFRLAPKKPLDEVTSVVR
jgi:hypothetical protein